MIGISDDTPEFLWWIEEPPLLLYSFNSSSDTSPPWHSPVTRLLFSLLIGAVSDVLWMINHPTSRTYRRHGERALGWIAGEEATISFTDVCSGLHIDPEAMRYALRRFFRAALQTPHRKYAYYLSTVKAIARRQGC